MKEYKNVCTSNDALCLSLIMVIGKEEEWKGLFYNLLRLDTSMEGGTSHC